MKTSTKSFRPANSSDNRTSIVTLRVLIALGLLALLYYYSWWANFPGVVSPWLEMPISFAWPWRIMMLALTTIYCTAQLLGNWMLYLTAYKRPATPAPTRSFTVDIFVTAYNEPFALIKRSLSAACRMRGAHNTWLLDDGNDPMLALLAKQLGAGYLTRTGHKYAKAGNVNAALARTRGEIVVIFDADHAPECDFLEKTLGYFNDPSIGFVQVMLTFSNAKQSWLARAANETSLDYYNPTSLGADGVGGTTLVGSNALIRRKALASIGGYQPGLAEDLATSIALHAGGWHSVYVAEPLAPGMAPPDAAAWFTQQFKWSRGVFELLLTSYPRYFSRLTWGMRLSYAVRMTYYWIGLPVALHIILTIALLMNGTPTGWATFEQYLLHVLPLGLIYLLIRQVALRRYRHPLVVAGLLWRAIVLVYATWPIYTLSWIMAVFRIPLGFRMTPKTAAGALNPLWILPQLVTLLLLGGGAIYLLVGLDDYRAALLLACAVIQCLPMVGLLWQSLRSVEAETIFESSDLAMSDPASLEVGLMRLNSGASPPIPSYEEAVAVAETAGNN
ncbi:MAG: glycosyltransferase [Chloroflexota bacterium]